MKPFILWGRKKVEVNTDPQRRCYNGCHAKSEWRWTPWGQLHYCATLEDAKESAEDFRRINPTHEYGVTKRDMDDPYSGKMYGEITVFEHDERGHITAYPMKQETT
ncbi:MAG: hypothetical protein LBV29_03070 [Azoarcus sp.]|jgi:hypothetical protein|nr:hypothetical protein [Azoarcus sp.]